jgi:hypothetical protein
MGGAANNLFLWNLPAWVLISPAFRVAALP